MSELLRRITRQISPHHNPEGLTWGKSRALLNQAKKGSVVQVSKNNQADMLATALVAKLADEFKEEVEHVERAASDPPRPRKINPKRPGRPEEDKPQEKRKSRARLTSSRVAELVQEASGTQESMYA
ncbi:LAQU0S07e01508g1_1 [Lachancea quebecensis]|uniref:LAQU0S07e01508g1_1 n=1 Tax=Lachancea quebecensis TaxID=1654605 RepID=A0A0P1KUQ0_9SACH|nr:LAQU0S07e01508g1_1 [Lachancea quebecensis]